MTTNLNLQVLATHVSIEDVENLITKQSMPQLIKEDIRLDILKCPEVLNE